MLQGSRYNISRPIEGNNDTCSYPVEAIASGTCPSQDREVYQAGYTFLDLDSPEGQPPDVAATVALLQFDNIDQVLLTFTVTHPPVPGTLGHEISPPSKVYRHLL